MFDKINSDTLNSRLEYYTDDITLLSLQYIEEKMKEDKDCYFYFEDKALKEYLKHSNPNIDTIYKEVIYNTINKYENIFNNIILVIHNIYDGRFKYLNFDYIDKPICHINLLNGNVIDSDDYKISNNNILVMKSNIVSNEDYIEYSTDNNNYYHINTPFVYRSGLETLNHQLSKNDNWTVLGNVRGINLEKVVSKCNRAIVDKDIDYIYSELKGLRNINNYKCEYSVDSINYIYYNSRIQVNDYLFINKLHRTIDAFNRFSAGVIIDDTILDSHKLKCKSHADLVRRYFNPGDNSSQMAKREMKILEDKDVSYIFYNYLKEIEAIVIDNDVCNYKISDKNIKDIIEVYGNVNIMSLEYSSNDISYKILRLRGDNIGRIRSTN